MTTIRNGEHALTFQLEPKTEVHEEDWWAPSLELTLHIIWDAASGRVRGFGCWLYVNGEDQRSLM